MDQSLHDVHSTDESEVHDVTADSLVEASSGEVDLLSSQDVPNLVESDQMHQQYTLQFLMCFQMGSLTAMGLMESIHKLAN